MIVRIDTGSAVPLYEQIAAAVEVEVSTGRLQRGESLPAARRLAVALDVNMHTVLKPYERLQVAGIIEIRRRRSGATVAALSSQRAQLLRMIEAVVKRAQDEWPERRRFLEMIGKAW